MKPIAVWQRLKDDKKAALVLGMLGVIYVALVFGVLPRQVFFSPDEGDKFVATASAARRGDLWSVAYQYPGHDIDPEVCFFFNKWFVVARGRPVPFHLSTLTFINGPLYLLFGLDGLYILPLLSGLGIAWVSYKLAGLLETPHAWIVALMVGVCTPVFFYSLTTWDHAPTVFYSTLIVYLIARQVRRFRHWETALAGAVVGLGLWTRFEMYLFAVAVGLAYLYVFRFERRFWQKLAPFVGGVVIVLMAMVIQQVAVYGTINTNVLLARTQSIQQDRASAVSLTETVQNVALRQARVLLALTLDSPAVWLERVFLALAFVGVIVVNRFPRLARRPSLVLGSVFLQVIGTALAVIHRQLPETIIGLVPTLPLASLGLVYTSPAKESRRPAQIALDWVATVSVCFLLLGLFLLPSFGGPAWGPRYIAPLFPLLTILAWATWGHAAQTRSGTAWQATRIAFGTLFAASLVMQCIGVGFLFGYKQNMQHWYEMTQEIKADYLISDSHWYLRQVSALYFEKTFYFVRGPQAYQTLMERLYRGGVRRFAWVADAEHRVEPQIVTPDFAIRSVGGMMYEIVPNP